VKITETPRQPHALSPVIPGDSEMDDDVGAGLCAHLLDYRAEIAAIKLKSRA
jgi:hypothetical protein